MPYGSMFGVGRFRIYNERRKKYSGGLSTRLRHSAFTKAMADPSLPEIFEKTKGELAETIKHEALDYDWPRDPRGHPHVSIDSCFEFCSCTVSQTSRDAPTVHRIVMHARGDVVKVHIPNTLRDYCFATCSWCAGESSPKWRTAPIHTVFDQKP